MKSKRDLDTKFVNDDFEYRTNIDDQIDVNNIDTFVPRVDSNDELYQEHQETQYKNDNDDFYQAGVTYDPNSGLVPFLDGNYEMENKYTDQNQGYTAENNNEQVEFYAEIDENGCIVPFTRTQIEERVFIAYFESKGRCLFAKVPIYPGEVIFVEAPVLAATPELNPELYQILEEMNAEQEFNTGLLWHLATLHCLTAMSEEDQNIILQKCVHDPKAPADEDAYRIIERFGLDVSPVLYQRYINVWSTNSFAHPVSENGLVLFDKISNADHSCGASAVWHFQTNNTFILRARKMLKPGDEISISYLYDGDLILPTHKRREKLLSWRFWCNCNRCSAPVDRCRGFLCPTCGSGSIFTKRELDEETQEEYSMAAPCNSCNYQFSVDEILYYEELENDYLERLKQMSKDDVLDCEVVYVEACKAFRNHYVLYQIEDILQHAYYDHGMYLQSAMILQKRIEFVAQAYNCVNFTIATLWEELGDILAEYARNQEVIDCFQKSFICRAYENAFNSYCILSGEDHDYTKSPQLKYQDANEVVWQSPQ